MEPRDTRYAFEWFMRSEDKRYWKLTKDLVKEEKENTIKTVAMLIAINMATTVVIASFLLRKFRKQ